MPKDRPNVPRGLNDSTGRTFDLVMLAIFSVIVLVPAFLLIALLALKGC